MTTAIYEQPQKKTSESLRANEVYVRLNDEGSAVRAEKETIKVLPLIPTKLNTETVSSDLMRQPPTVMNDYTTTVKVNSQQMVPFKQLEANVANDADDIYYTIEMRKHSPVHQSRQANFVSTETTKSMNATGKIRNGRWKIIWLATLLLLLATIVVAVILYFQSTSQHHADMVHCPTNPCKNGGQCVLHDKDFKCQCPSDFTGKHCEVFNVINPCTNGSCNNGGTCMRLSTTSFQCVCDRSHTGQSCEIYIDLCQSNPCENGGKCIHKNDGFVCQCQQGFTGVRCEEEYTLDGVAFCAVRSTSLTTATNLVTFDNVTVNYGNAFNLATSQMTAPWSGLYWLHISVGLEPETTTDVRLLGANRPLNILRTNKMFVGGADTTSRDEIMSLKSQCSELSISSDSKLYSDQYLQTTFAGFFINNIVDPLIAFSFALSTSFKSTAADENIPFDVIHIDTLSGWNVSSNSYTVKIPGVYVMSFSSAANALSNPFVLLKVNGKGITGLFFGGGINNGIETLSKTVLHSLNEGDKVSSVLDARYGDVYSDIRYQTTLKGFLYNPHRSDPVSWFVALELLKSTSGPLDPISFNHILVNQGSGWNRATNRLIIPSSGVYYVQISAGVPESKPMKLELLLNGTPVINIFRQFTSPAPNDVRSRSAIFRLHQGDELYIRLPAGYYIWSNMNKYVAFGGFRLFE